jgi:hypothetical protein
MRTLRSSASPALVFARLAPLALAACVGTTTLTTGTGGAGGEGGQGGQGAQGGDAGAGGEAGAGAGGQAGAGAGGAPGCTEGDTQPCYSGAPETRGVGLCADGTQTCADGVFPLTCDGEVLPATELCNGEDDDCNGTIDDLGTQTCGVGACASTAYVCLNGVPQTCTEKLPSLELCDGVDNDCDGETDETDPNVGLVCSTGLVGSCGPGTFQCVAGPNGGAALKCVADKGVTQEACNGKDDDCDGVVDNNLISTGAVCDTNLFGICAAGTKQCVDGIIDCMPDIPPSAELCNAIDDDCDGLTDEDNPEGGGACDTGQLGVCAAGTLSCNNAMLECIPTALASAETCNGIDDNCDGVADEGNPGGGVACGCSGTTACVNGAIACEGGPVVYFQDDFGGGPANTKGWTIGPTWGIGFATASSGGSGNPDPSMDKTPTADNMLAGVVIGGNAPTALHDFYWLESAPFNTAAAPAVILSYWRWLNSDYTPYMQNKVQVFNGSTWVDVWATGAAGTYDNAWVKQTFDVSAYKNANMRVRFGYNIASGGVFTIGSWNLDDVLVSSASCP